jgi:hypothetical protein
MPNLAWKDALQRRDPPAVAGAASAEFDPTLWTCSVCGKVRARDLLHSKAIRASVRSGAPTVAEGR